MDLSTPSWDLFIVLFLIIAVGYGFLLQRERIVVTMVSAYIGLVVTSLFWPSVLGFFTGENPLAGRYFIRASFSEAQIQIGLFLGSMILVSSKGGIDAERGRGWLSSFELAVLSGLTGAMIIAAILHFLPAETTAPLVAQSKLVAYLVNYYSLWIAGPAAALVFLGFRDGGRRS